MAEQRFQPNSVEELDDLADDFAARMKAALRQVVVETTKNLRTLDVVTTNDVDAIKTEWARVAPTLALDAQKIWLDAGQRTASQLQRAITVLTAAIVPGPKPKAPLSESEAAWSYLENATNRIKGVGDSAWSAARRELATGMFEGESIGNLADRVRGSLGVSLNDAERIARTETISAANAGSIATMRASGVVAEKEWIATFDTRTRETHATANNQVRPLDEPFAVGGASMDHPGDPIGPADEVINCRCSMTYVIGEYTPPPPEISTTNLDPDGPLEGEAAFALTDELTPDMNEFLARSLVSYQGQSYTDINGFLRHNRPVNDEFVYDRIADIDSAIEFTEPLDEPIVVYRGITNAVSVFGNQDWTGMRFVDEGFVSTTTDLDVAKNFAWIDNMGITVPGGAIMRITVPEGIRALNVTDAVSEETQDPYGEAEVLLKRGTRFKITSVTGSQEDGWEIEAEVVR